MSTDAIEVGVRALACLGTGDYVEPDDVGHERGFQRNTSAHDYSGPLTQPP